MADARYDESMTCQELCARLKELGMEGGDLKKINDGKFNGKTILMMQEEGLGPLKLSRAGKLVLERVLEKAGGRRDQTDGTDLPCPSLKPSNECEQYTSFGLGRGVDATESSPLSGKHGKVRLVLPNLKNVQEETRKGEKDYKEHISSIVSYSSSISLSVSDIVAKSLSLSAEGEFSRDKTREIIAKGRKVITRDVSFKPFYSKEYHSASSPDVEDSSFEREVCEWIVKQFPDASAMPGKTDAERVQAYLGKFPDMVDEVIETTYVFIKTERLTHYISSISLGAAEYSVSTMKKTKLSTGVRGEAGHDLVVKGGAGVKRSSEKSSEVSEKRQIGDISSVSRGGDGEAVVGFEILPVYMLVCQESVKKVVQKAVQFYLERESGPFFIVCGSSLNRYLSVSTMNNQNVLTATDKKENADFFFIEKSLRPREFNIAFYTFIDKSASVYAVTKSRLTGKDSGPLQMGGGRPTKFTLRHLKKHKGSLSIDVWEKEALYVKVAPRLTQHASYLALSERTNFAACVPKRSLEKRGHSWLQFKLERVRCKESSRMTVYRAPGGRRDRRSQLAECKEDGEEEEEELDFAFEFDQISSDEEKD